MNLFYRTHTFGQSDPEDVFVDTEPIIETYGAYIGSNGAITASGGNYCVTKIYPFDTAKQSYLDNGKTKISIRYIMMSDKSMTNGRIGWYIDNTYKANTYVYPKVQKTVGSANREDAATNHYNGVRFTLDSTHLDDSYAYFLSTGDIIFAGKNTKYYGHKNIRGVK